MKDYKHLSDGGVDWAGEAENANIMGRVVVKHHNTVADLEGFIARSSEDEQRQGLPVSGDAIATMKAEELYSDTTRAA